MFRMVNQQINGLLRTTPGKFELNSRSVLGRMVNQQINGVLRTIPGKFELHSRSVLGRTVNQQINRNLRAMPNFSSACFNFQSTYQRGISLALGKIWAFFWSVMISLVNQQINRNLRSIHTKIVLDELKDLWNSWVSLSVHFQFNRSTRNMTSYYGKN